jgi:asparagine synthase (glutamine-hydrolysing)
VPLHFVSALAREHVTVVLTGEGSDELLAGYGKYPRALSTGGWGGVYERASMPSSRRWVSRARGAAPAGRAGRIRAAVVPGVPRTPSAMFFDNFAGVPLQDQRAVLAPPCWRDAERAYARRSRGSRRHRRLRSLLDRMLYADLKTYLVELLMKQDQMSMAASIESRVPFLDHRLVEFAATPAGRVEAVGMDHQADAARGGARPAARSILERPKMGFPVPFGPGRAAPGTASSATCCSTAHA